MKTLRHEEIGGGYSIRKKIIIDACEISSGEFNVMALYENGEELEEIETNTETEAIQVFNKMFEKYAGELQKALYGKLETGKKYTIVHIGEFGFPIAQKITFHSMKCTTYAQHVDVVKMIFTPYRKRNQYQKYFYNTSFMIFEGWQDLKESDTKEVLKDDGNIKLVKSKYACFDSRYIDDLENVFKNPVVIYKNYKTGVNGKLYA